MTDSMGTYRFLGLAAGEYRVAFERPIGYVPTRTNVGNAGPGGRVSMHDDGYCVEEVFAGETMSEVLRYVNYEQADLIRQLKAKLDRCATMDEADKTSFAEAYAAQLASYTYLAP